MSSSLLLRFRLWHRKVAGTLFVFFFIISLTGVLLGWKSMFIKNIFENSNVKPSTSRQAWLSLELLEKMAAQSLTEKTNQPISQPERIELRPAKGFINMAFKNNYYVQVDGATGACIKIEQKNGGIIQDIHDGAIVGALFHNDGGWSKKVYSSIMGLAILSMTITGFYLWYKPRQIKLVKK